MSLRHKPGDKIEVDWAGQAVPIIDRDTGEVMNASIFVGVLPYSQYIFTYALRIKNWKVGLKRTLKCIDTSNDQ